MRRRFWRRGPKRGMARGVSVFGSPGATQDAAGLSDLLEHHEALAHWLALRGLKLRYDAEGLASVEAAIDAWRGDPEIAPMLGNEVGTYLGAVIVREVPGAEWHVWPNGHPVIRAGHRNEIDVVALAHRRLATGQPSLSSVLSGAEGSS